MAWKETKCLMYSVQGDGEAPELVIQGTPECILEFLNQRNRLFYDSDSKFFDYLRLVSDTMNTGKTIIGKDFNLLRRTDSDLCYGGDFKGSPKHVEISLDYGDMSPEQLDMIFENMKFW